MLASRGAGALVAILVGSPMTALSCSESESSAFLQGGSNSDSGPGPEADAGADAAIICSGPLADAGFSTLADLPVAELCADSVLYGSGLVLEGMMSCAGTIMVTEGKGADCGSWWLFDSTTGALEASGAECNTNLSCTGAAPGFSFPNQCFNGFWTQFWGERQERCPDGT